MQAVVVYGRFIARAIATGFSNEFQQLKESTFAAPRSLTGPSFHLVTASSGIPKGDANQQVLKSFSIGDDACFVAKNTSADVIGVADGVGGWRNYGVDPSQFPNSLMALCARMVEEGKFKPQAPAEILENGYHELLENKEHLIGSCTACLVSLHKEKRTVYTANLGDSGFMIIRSGEVIHRSVEQQHYFNTPFQLSISPTDLQDVLISDSPRSAEQTSFPVREGDVILVGTDGLFDNMSDQMILYHISKLRDSRKESVQRVANTLAREAHTLAFDPDYMSPFAMEAQAHGIEMTGGKPDDITVILATVADGDPT